MLVYSKTLEEHQEHLKVDMKVLRTNQLYAKASKCLFAQRQVDYLGHVMSAKRVSMDMNKVKDIAERPTPGSIKTLIGFLGLTGYYKRFIRNYGIICKPLTKVLEKDAFGWNKEA